MELKDQFKESIIQNLSNRPRDSLKGPKDLEISNDLVLWSNLNEIQRKYIYTKKE
jgi:hypothetical protein